MNLLINHVRREVASLREILVHHPVYSKINSIESLRIFMEHHVFAVWDFMSLLKSLQRELTCVHVPWVPVSNPAIRHFINEIVCGEESDVDQFGNRTSHYELYLNAMTQVGCSSEGINSLIAQLKAGHEIDTAIDNPKIPFTAQAFVRNTFETIYHRPLHVQAAVFTFGREDLIPEMFLSMIVELNSNTKNKASIFEYYVKRHIEVDGDHHSHLAQEMTIQLCGTDVTRWSEAILAIKRSLLARIALWNSIQHSIELSGVVRLN